MDDTATPSASGPASACRPGDAVRHVQFGFGRILDQEADFFHIRFKGGEMRRVSRSYPGLSPVAGGDAQVALIKEAVREALGEAGWIDCDNELAPRWNGGTMVLKAGKEGLQDKEFPLDALFKKIIGIREKLRVLEQKINNHPRLEPEDKLELQGYITRSYGSLTSFNLLFADKSGWFVGQSGKDE